MHGYFVNVQLYSRAKQESEPFAFEQFKQKKIKEDMDRERHDRVQLEVSEERVLIGRQKFHAFDLSCMMDEVSNA